MNILFNLIKLCIVGKCTKIPLQMSSITSVSPSQVPRKKAFSQEDLKTDKNWTNFEKNKIFVWMKVFYSIFVTVSTQQLTVCLFVVFNIEIVAGKSLTVYIISFFTRWTQFFFTDKYMMNGRPFCFYSHVSLVVFSITNNCILRIN